MICRRMLREVSNLIALLPSCQVEYAEYVKGIVPPIQELLKEFREAKMPIFWSTWWRWGPEDGFFNSMDRFYGPVGSRTQVLRRVW